MTLPGQTERLVLVNARHGWMVAAAIANEALLASGESSPPRTPNTRSACAHGGMRVPSHHRIGSEPSPAQSGPRAQAERTSPTRVQTRRHGPGADTCACAETRAARVSGAEREGKFMIALRRRKNPRKKDSPANGFVKKSAMLARGGDERHGELLVLNQLAHVEVTALDVLRFLVVLRVVRQVAGKRMQFIRALINEPGRAQRKAGDGIKGALIYLIDNSACESLTRNVGVSKPTEHFL